MRENPREIALNFLPINRIEFKFDVWCRISLPEEKKWDDDIRLFDLKNEIGEYKKYWVSFKEFNNSKKRIISSEENIDLTKYQLFYLLKQKIISYGINFEQIEKEKRFAPYHLYLITEKAYFGRRTIRFEPYYLKADNIFGFLVDYKFIKSNNIPFNKEIQKLSFSLDESFKSNANYHIDKYQYIKRYLKKYFKDDCGLTKEIKLSIDFHSLKYKSLKLRNYIFNENNKGKSQFKGINEFGPYKKIQCQLKYVYVYQKSYKDYVKSLISALNGESFNTFEGLQKFGLPAQDRTNIESILIESFEDRIEDCLDKISGQAIIIAIFPLREEKFYYTLKNICLKKDIPLQAVHLETILDENKLKWSVSGIALQIFAKLGGIPWIVESQNQDCLIIGIGQSIEKNDEKGFIRFLAYSVLFDSSGRFIKVEPLAEAYDNNDYIQKICEVIPSYITRTGYKKIVFHIPQKISRKAIRKIEDTLRSTKTDIEVYIIRVNDDSKFFGYDLNNNSLIPYESSYVKLSSKEYLMWTEGLNYHNPIPRKRYGNPIYIEFFYSNKSEVDHELFLQDILNLSGTNYRGFNAKSLPVSMFYPKLISNFIKNFNKHNLNTDFESRDKMWFL
jgi:hypothetical protein